MTGIVETPGGPVRLVRSQSDGAGAGAEESRHDPQQRRLAGAIGTPDREHIAALQGKRNARENRPPATVGGKIFTDQSEGGEGGLGVWHRPAKFTIRPRIRAVASRPRFARFS
jgi:hypothetical protein